MLIRNCNIILRILHPEMFTDKVAIHNNGLSMFPPKTGHSYLLSVPGEIFEYLLLWV